MHAFGEGRHQRAGEENKRVPDEAREVGGSTQREDADGEVDDGEDDQRGVPRGDLALDRVVSVGLLLLPFVLLLAKFEIQKFWRGCAGI